MRNQTKHYLAGIVLLLASCQASENRDGEYLLTQDLSGSVWKMDYSMEIHEDTSYRHVPEHWSRIKTFTQNRFTFTGYDYSTNQIAGIGGGTYQLMDSIYTEDIEFHHESTFNGTRFQGRLYFDSLYLYQEGSVGDLVLKERWHRID